MHVCTIFVIDHRPPDPESWHSAATAAMTALGPAEGILSTNSEGGEREGLLESKMGDLMERP